MSSVRPALPNRNQTRVYSKAPSRKQEVLTSDGDYVETEFQYAEPEGIQQPTQQRPTSSAVTVGPTAVLSSKPGAKKGHRYLVVLGIALMVCMLIVALVAVVLYRPTSPHAQSAPVSVQQLNSLVQRLLNETEQIQKQFRQLTDAQSSMETDIGQLSTFQMTTNSLLGIVQNSLSTFSSVQETQGESINKLRTVDLYSGCTTETRQCTLSTSGSSSYYWRSCSTNSLYVEYENQDVNKYVTNVWCDITSSQYMETFHIYRTGSSIRCECQVTRPVSSTGSTIEGHSTLTSSYSATCTLRVIRCPRSVNLLA